MSQERKEVVRVDRTTVRHDRRVERSGQGWIALMIMQGTYLEIGCIVA